MSKFVLSIIISVLAFTNTAFAGGSGGTVYNRLYTKVPCTSVSQCNQFLSLPQVTDVACTQKVCMIRYGVCPEFTGYTSKWNATTKACDAFLKAPSDLICSTDAECQGSPGAGLYGDVLADIRQYCDKQPGVAQGICTTYLAEATCCAWGFDGAGNCLPKADYCFSNSDCFTKDQACVNHECRTPSFSTVIGDGNVCLTNQDCNVPGTWGLLCVDGGSPLGSQCQECSAIDTDGDNVDDGCTPERPYCMWGISWSGPLGGKRSFNECMY